MALTDKLTAIADAIRAKTGGTAALTLDQMPTEIDGIETGGSGGPLQAKTAYPSHSEQIIAPDEDYYGLVSVTVKPVPRLPACEIKVVQLLNDVRYLNHKAMAEIPEESLAEYPYAALVVDSDGAMALWLSTEKMYVATNDEGIDRLNIPANRVYYGFNAAANVWLVQYAYTTAGGYSINGDGSIAVWWANHDICIGSADSGEIYFPASQPQEVQPADATHYYYNGVRLPAIPTDLLAQYPCAWIRKNTNTGYYDLVLCEVYFYYDPNTLCLYDSNYKPKYHYQIEIAKAETATEWVFNQEFAGGFVVDDARPCIWTNTNILNGSTTATEIYLQATLAVPDPLQGGAL